MGRLVFNPRLFLRPWFFPVAAVAFAILLNDYLIGIAAGFGAVAADLLRLHLRGHLESIGSHFLWAWLIAVARQIGFVRGTLQRLCGLVEVPDSDKHAIQLYGLLLRGSK